MTTSTPPPAPALENRRCVPEEHQPPSAERVDAIRRAGDLILRVANAFTLLEQRHREALVTPMPRDARARLEHARATVVSTLAEFATGARVLGLVDELEAYAALVSAGLEDTADCARLAERFRDLLFREALRNPGSGTRRP